MGLGRVVGLQVILAQVDRDPLDINAISLTSTYEANWELHHIEGNAVNGQSIRILIG